MTNYPHRKCEWCGAPFIPAPRRRLFCCDVCRRMGLLRRRMIDELQRRGHHDAAEVVGGMMTHVHYRDA